MSAGCQDHHLLTAAAESSSPARRRVLLSRRIRVEPAAAGERLVVDSVHVLHDPNPARPLRPLAVAKVLCALALQENPSFVSVVPSLSPAKIRGPSHACSWLLPGKAKDAGRSADGRAPFLGPRAPRDWHHAARLPLQRPGHAAATGDLSSLLSHLQSPRPDSRIVYIDGAFDLFHAGHVEVFYYLGESNDQLSYTLGDIN